jgi:hypothetical protein
MKEMKTIALLAASVVLLSGQAPSEASAPVRHLVYEFGYNTKAASAGQGTGTLAVDISGPAADGGIVVSGTDHWWNTPRARATNTCEVYPNGNVNCKERPYAISPMQLTLFPLLGRSFFEALGTSGNGSWQQTYTVYAALLPAASGSANAPNTWKCTFAFEGKGPISGAAGSVLIQDSGTLAQTSGRYYKATSKQRIAYQTRANVPVAVSDTRTYIPQTSVYSNGLVELKLIKDSQKH